MIAFRSGQVYGIGWVNTNNLNSGYFYQEVTAVAGTGRRELRG